MKKKKKRTKKDLEERAKSDPYFRLWDKDVNLLVDYEEITEEGKKRLKAAIKESK